MGLQDSYKSYFRLLIAKTRNLNETAVTCRLTDHIHYEERHVKLAVLARTSGHLHEN
jgi:hypothetical protein